jgi:hypothetical protein
VILDFFLFFTRRALSHFLHLSGSSGGNDGEEIFLSSRNKVVDWEAGWPHMF